MVIIRFMAFAWRTFLHPGWLFEVSSDLFPVVVQLEGVLKHHIFVILPFHDIKFQCENQGSLFVGQITRLYVLRDGRTRTPSGCCAR